MKVYVGNTVIECTPGEYIELQQKGVFLSPNQNKDSLRNSHIRIGSNVE